MKNKFCAVYPYVIAATLVVLLLLLSDLAPCVPPICTMANLLAATVFLVLFAGFVMKENGGDERDALHRLNAGRVSYLSAIAVLTVALVVQGLAHDIDPWILITLGVMVVVKVAAHFYSNLYQ